MALTKDELLNQARQCLDIINVTEAEALMASGSIMLDVREPNEFDMGHLSAAINIPRGLLEFMVGNNPALTDFDKSIVVYCKNGGRSTLAADTLQSMGFSKIKMLAGGFDDWTGTIHKVEVADNQYNG
jgi:rhodanese-related sulfurtransferase